MKRTEVAMIVLVASLSMLFAFTIAQSFFGDKVKRKVLVEQTQSISDSIAQPSKRIFHAGAINPTVEVCVESTSTDLGGESGGCTMTTPSPYAASSETPAGQSKDTKTNAN